MELRAIVVEDEETSREILKNYLQKYCPGVQVLGEAANTAFTYGYDSVTQMQESKVTLCKISVA